MAGNFLKTMKLTVGAFDLDALTTKEGSNTIVRTDREDWEHILWWFIFICYLIFGNIIILNFIIAEVGNSYSKVREIIERHVQKERCKMIEEAEEVINDQI